MCACRRSSPSCVPSRIERTLKEVAFGWGATKSLAEGLSAKLLAAYAAPHRRYHTVAHIEHCLGEIARVERHATHPDEVKWALLFHDAIYDPERSDNEARSAGA